MDLFDLTKFSIRKKIKLNTEEGLMKNRKNKHQIFANKEDLQAKFMDSVPVMDSVWCCKKLTLKDDHKNIEQENKEKTNIKKDDCLIF